MRSSPLGRAAAAALLVAPLAFCQTLSYIPDNAPVLTSGNTIPFGSAAYTYMIKVPASYMSPTELRIEEIALMPGFTSTWIAPNCLIGVGHLPAALPCPFNFPDATLSTIGSFTDFTVAYDSAVNGPMNWACTNNAWSPFGLTALGGTSFIWNGVDDVGIYITFSGATGGGSIRRNALGVHPHSRTYASTYQAAASTSCNATFAAYVRLTLVATSGLFANFTAANTSGPAPLNVTFTDTTFTSDPAGVQGWAWDFDGDLNIDSTAQNPSHTYLVPGDYSVSMTVTDTLHPSSTKTVTNMVHVGPYVFDVFTTGGGVGDLVITPVPSFGNPTTVQGYTFLSFTPVGAVGSGPAFGLTPDINFWNVLFLAPSAGNPLSYLPAPGFYPDVPFALPAGAVSFLTGVTVDFVQVGINGAYLISLVSNVDRVTF
jgi:PKD repeat protein